MQKGESARRDGSGVAGKSPLGKSPRAFRTIGEAAQEIGEETHVLRFWEQKFKPLQPSKNGGGRRLYRVQDMALLRAVQFFLRQREYTIAGVQKLLQAHGVEAFIEMSRGGDGVVSVASDNVNVVGIGQLKAIRDEMQDLRAELVRLLESQ